MIDKHILILVGAVSVMFVTVMVILANSITSSNRNFGAILNSESDVIQLLLNINGSLAKLIESNANLTKEETDQLVYDLQKIPAMVETLDNLTKTVDIDTQGAKTHRNLTMQNYEDLQEIKQQLNNMTTGQ